MNYGDFLKFVKYNRMNNTEDTAGQVLNELINYSSVIDGSNPYFYLDSHNNVRIANAVDNFQTTELMQKGHRKLIENLNGEDSDYWMERTVNALGRNKKISFDNDWAAGSDNVKAFKEWYNSGKPELSPEAVNKVISSKARIPNSTDTAEDFYFNNKRFKRVETGEKGSTITKFYNDDGDIIRTTYKNTNGELKTVDSEGNFVRKTINTKTNGFNIEYGQKNEKGKETINEIRQIDENGKVSPRKEDTKQTVNDTSEQYNTEGESKVEQTKQESGPKMEIEGDGSTKVRTDSNGNEMYTFEDLQREAEERRRRAQEKNGGNTSSENTKSYDGNVNNPYYENDKDIWNPEAGSKEKLEEALNTKPPGKDEVIYENGDTVVMGRNPFENIIDELDEDDILMEQQMGSRDNIQKEHSRQQQEEEPEPEQINVNEEEVSDNAINEEVDSITKNTNPEKAQTTFEDEIDQIARDLADGNISSDEAHKLVDEAYEKHKDSLNNLEDVVNQEQKKVEKFETEQAKETGKERPTFEDVVENAKEAREVNQEKTQYNKDSNPQYNQQHPTENLNKEKKPQTTEEVIENAKKQRRKAQRKKGDGKPQYNQQEPYTKPPQVKAKEKTKKPQVNPEPKFEDSIIDLVNKNHEKNKKTQPKTVWQQTKDTYKEIKDVLANNRRAKRQSVFNLSKKGKYEYLNVRTSQGRVSVVRNRRNGNIIERSFASTGEDELRYVMTHNKNGILESEMYNSKNTIGNKIERYKRGKQGERKISGASFIDADEIDDARRRAEEAFEEAGNIAKRRKADWTESDANAFNLDVTAERDKWWEGGGSNFEPYTADERNFINEREKIFKDDLDAAEQDLSSFKENNKGKEKELRKKVNDLEKQVDDPRLTTAQKDKARRELADASDELDKFKNRKKALKDKRKKTKQDYNNRNTEGKINQELKDLAENDFSGKLEQLEGIDLTQLSDKEKAKIESEIKAAKEGLTKEQALSKLKRNVTKSKRDISKMGPSEFVKEIGVGGVVSGLTAIGTYKDNRREGRSVLSSAARAGVDFVLSETLGFGAYMALNLVKEVPDLAVKGAAALFKETRRMNSAARFSTFGDASFQDTQQLATMRQSGMELAKMSQYRLEQTLMGNEAKYLHR